MRYITLALLLCLNVTAFSQTDSTASLPDSTTSLQDSVRVSLDSVAVQSAIVPAVDSEKSASAQPLAIIKEPKIKKPYPKNVVKLNLGSLLLFDNYHFVYERSLTRKISASLGYRTMPATQLNLIPAVEKTFKHFGEEGNELIENLSKITASNKTYTAEFRFYAGRKPGPRGFYLGLYGRYATFNVDYDYLFEGDTKDYNIPISSSSKGIGGGGFIGVQWLIGKRVAIDWQILGGHWGKLTGDGNSVVDLSQMSAMEKNYLKSELEDLIPSIGDKSIITANVNDNGVKLKLDGPFVGLRSGISIGIAF